MRAPPAIADSSPRVLCAPGSPLEGLLRFAAALAQSECPLFLGGESGTGKELLARFVHAHSRRAAGPFVAVNCAAISPGLAESELFGHRRGAFTGALADRPGRMRAAQGGTLFLDEIGDMPLDLQGRLLRAIQEKRVCPVGGDVETAVDFRLLCATHRDLNADVEAGRFRADLYYRVRVLELRLPPLRERPSDIPFLLRAFLAELLGETTAAAALAGLPAAVLSHPFPGNVRELRNLAERYAALHAAGAGWREAFGHSRPKESTPPKKDTALRNSRLQREEILAVLAACGYHRGRAAEKLGVTRRALQYRLAGWSALISA